MTLAGFVAANSVSQSLLTVLKFCFLALLYLFLVLVVRVVLRELRATKITVQMADPAPVAPPAPIAEPARSRRGRGGLRLQFHDPSGGADLVALGDEMTIGRAAGCGIVLDRDTFISQVHARIFQQGSDTYLEDLGSTNGTFLNGERLDAPVRLRKGDRVQFGNTLADVVR